MNFQQVFSCEALPVLTNLSKRTKPTCVDASAEFLIVGASTGNIYVFSRNKWSLIRILSLTSSDKTPDPITLVKIK